MKKCSVLTGVAITLAAFGSASLAADADAGKAQYGQTCIACHGPGGISVAPIYPNLRGQKGEYLVMQLKAYRDGQRPNAIMAPMAKGLSDTQIVNLAAYLSALKGN